MTTAKAAATLCIFISGSGCGRYADFTLPVLPADQALKVQPSLLTRAAPVLEREAASDVLNPSVVWDKSQFFNFYSEYDGQTWHSTAATSFDGFVWQRRGRFLSPDSKSWEGTYIAANGSAARLSNEWVYWYVAGQRDRPNIGFAHSNDAKAWTKHPVPVLVPGPRGSFDEYGVADPYVLQIGDWLYMYYLGQNRAREQQLGLARSTASGESAGVKWEKLRSNPVLTVSAPGSGAMDESGLGEPAVWQSQGWYWMLFTGRDLHENRTLGFARSLDGVQWVRLATVAREQPWESKVMCDPTVVVKEGKTLVWFGGGDAARPDEKINGQIGFGEVVFAAIGSTQR